MSDGMSLLLSELDYNFFPVEYRVRIRKSFENPSRYDEVTGRTLFPRGFPDGKDRILTHRDLLKVIGTVHPLETKSSALLVLLQERFQRLPEIGEKSSRLIAGYVLVRGLDEFIPMN